MTTGLSPLITIVIGVSAVLALSGSASAQGTKLDKLLAADEYANSCQVCHGEGGKGDGPLAQYLNVRPSDLTQLARKHDGEFPFLKVFQTVDGRAVIGAHGGRSMPVWGLRYSREVGDTYGPYGGEQAIRARVLELVYYIQSLQEK